MKSLTARNGLRGSWDPEDHPQSEIDKAALGILDCSKTPVQPGCVYASAKFGKL
jgi:hypothetical protein